MSVWLRSRLRRDSGDIGRKAIVRWILSEWEEANKMPGRKRRAKKALRRSIIREAVERRQGIECFDSE
jgi:hypothetical protein